MQMKGRGEQTLKRDLNATQRRKMDGCGAKYNMIWFGFAGANEMKWDIGIVERRDRDERAGKEAFGKTDTKAKWDGDDDRKRKRKDPFEIQDPLP